MFVFNIGNRYWIVTLARKSSNPVRFTICGETDRNCNQLWRGGVRPCGSEERKSRVCTQRSPAHPSIRISNFGSVLGEKIFAQCRACDQIGETRRMPLGRSWTACSAGRSGPSKATAIPRLTRARASRGTRQLLSHTSRTQDQRFRARRFSLQGRRTRKRIQDPIAYLKQFDVVRKKSAAHW